MTFGADFGEVVQHIECPRCQAPCYVRARAKTDSQLIERHLVCKRCHLIEWCGFTTPEAFKDSKRLLKLKKLESKHGSKVGGRIKREIAMLEERMVLHGLVGTGHRSSVGNLRRAEKEGEL